MNLEFHIIFVIILKPVDVILAIDDTKTIEELQDKFNECFPFLEIEFYATRHRWQHPSADAPLADGTLRLAEIRKNHRAGLFTIYSNYKIGKVEQDLRHYYGLYVQVFYLLKGVWIQSISADDLTLGQLMDLSFKAANCEPQSPDAGNVVHLG